VDAWNRGDLSALVELFDPEIVWFGLPGNPDYPDPVHGPAAVLGAIEEWLAPWSHYEIETLDVIEVGRGVIWAARHIAAQERTGMTLEARMSAALTLRGGRIAEARFFFDSKDAFAAAGDHRLAT
jgi:ketosteroid isomerase-like protein